MKLPLPKEPHVVFLVWVQCNNGIIWRHILTYIRAKQRQITITQLPFLIYSVFIQVLFNKDIAN